MTTREEYAEAAEEIEEQAIFSREAEEYMLADRYDTAVRVLRALADGAVLCRKGSYPHADGERSVAYYPIEEQP